jgi:hypothetical protein
MVWLWDSILEHLHHHTFSSMLFDKISEARYAQILSCSSLRVGAWIIVRPIFPNFQLTSLIFSITLWIHLRLPHLSIANILWCVCTHPIDLMGIHLLHCVHGNEHMETHDGIHNTFGAIVWYVGFHVGREQLNAFLQTCSTPPIDKSTLCSPKMAFAP